MRVRASRRRRQPTARRRESGPRPGPIVPRPHGVGQPAGPANDRHGPVAEGDELAEAARLVAGRHEEEIGAGVDPPGQALVEPDVHGDRLGVRPGELAEQSLEVLLPRPEDDQLAARGPDGEDRARDQIEPFCSARRLTTPTSGVRRPESDSPISPRSAAGAGGLAADVVPIVSLPGCPGRWPGSRPGRRDRSGCR